nr:GatB/YqeY domain-containing protein [Persephonella sp.]
MGRVMKSVMEKVKGRADGSIVSSIVKKKLS